MSGSEYIDDFTQILGKVFFSVTQTGDEITFKESSRTDWVLRHDQDCCESVYIEDICGDLEDIQDSPILDFRRETNEDNPIDPEDESYTWTFFIISTIKGTVTIRFYGSSNGYYSEDANLYRIQLGFDYEDSKVVLHKEYDIDMELLSNPYKFLKTSYSEICNKIINEEYIIRKGI